MAPLHLEIWHGQALTAEKLFANQVWLEAHVQESCGPEEEPPDGEPLYDPRLHGPIHTLPRELKRRWARMSPAARQVWENAAEAERAAEASITVTAGSSLLPILDALLARSPGVQMLSLTNTWSTPASTKTLCASDLLRRVGAAWGGLHAVHLGEAAVAAADIHALLAACPQLLQLCADGVRLAEGRADADTLFGEGMAEHTALRYIALPAMGDAFVAAVRRLLRRCPALLEIDADQHQVDDDDESEEVELVAREGAARGLRRFFCRSCFVDGNTYYGSEDYDAEDEYVGNGDLLQNMH